jgi:hypothetical protein
MAVYTVHLGFNWNSPLIGSFWNSEGAATERFLQYAISTSSGAPAWFQFAAGDSLSFEIWDLSSVQQQPGGPAFGMGVSFSPLEGSSSTIQPSDVVSAAQSVATTTSRVIDDRKQYGLQFASVVSSAGGSCPWGTSVGHYRAGSIELTAQRSYKMSFYLKISYAGENRVFISDPEVIVGSRGG